MYYYSVTTRNKFIGKYERISEPKRIMTLNEQRIVMFLISLIEMQEKKFKTVTVSIRNFCRLFGISYNSATAKSMKQATENLTNDMYESGGLRFRWLDECCKSEGSTLILKLDDSILPCVTDLHGDFVNSKLGYMAFLKNAHTIRLYQLLKSKIYYVLKSRKNYSVSFDALSHQILCVNYSRFSELDHHILRRAISEINEKTDILVSYRKVKDFFGNVNIEFRIRPQTTDKLEEIENKWCTLDFEGEFIFDIESEEKTDDICEEPSEEFPRYTLEESIDDEYFAEFGDEPENMCFPVTDFDAEIDISVDDDDWNMMNL